MKIVARIKHLGHQMTAIESRNRNSISMEIVDKKMKFWNWSTVERRVEYECYFEHLVPKIVSFVLSFLIVPLP